MDTLREHLFLTVLSKEDTFKSTSAADARVRHSPRATINCLPVGETTARSQHGGAQGKLTRAHSPPFHAATISVIAGRRCQLAATDTVGGWSAISIFTQRERFPDRTPPGRLLWLKLTRMFADARCIREVLRRASCHLEARCHDPY